MATNSATGLTSAEVAGAPKNLPPHHATSLELAWRVAKGQILSFFFILLIISGGLSLLLHEKVDATVFFAIAGINAALGFFQEFRANRSAQLLEKLVAHLVTVRRNGVVEKIPHTEIVLADILLLNPGDILVVDARIISSKDAFLDESVVTGESVPRLAQPGEEIASGTTLSSGNIVAEVIRVGQDNSLIQYAEKVTKIEKNSNFEKFIHRISKTIMIITVACLLAVFLINVLITRQMQFPEYVLFGISMLVGVVPESLPLIVTLILTREAITLSKQQVLIKKLSALQNLGAMNYLFTDKTGTITENKLQVKEIVALDPGLKDNLAAIAGGNYERMPMDEVFDNALSRYFAINALKTPAETSHAELGYEAYQTARGYAIHILPGGNTIFRGQYDAVINACANPSEEFRNTCKQFESRGLRVIAVAQAPGKAQPATLQGAVIFEDPLKPDAISIYKTLSDLKIDVKIITGDSLEVAQYIGGILRPKMTANFAYAMDNSQASAQANLNEYFIYARCKPEQKSILIDQHEQHGVVGFLGEGINDALALKRADIGFVVSNASDVARQASDVILLEKSLQPIVTAVMMSRQAFIKVRTYLLCTLTGNLGTLFSLTAVVLISQQIPLLPIQILLNNLLTDLPLLFLITDKISKHSLQSPVKDEMRKFFQTIIIFAALSSVFDFIFFFFFRHYDITVLRTGWFVFSVFAELTLVLSLRSERPLFKAPRISTIFAAALIICFAAAIALPYLPVGSVFHFVPLSVVQVAVLFGITIIYLAVNELMKRVLRRHAFLTR
jgi:Mg2+-importing ATPase